ncbi:MAG: hypothetical protein ACPGYX_12510, partial [Oceanobacter sp.]
LAVGTFTVSGCANDTGSGDSGSGDPDSGDTGSIGPELVLISALQGSGSSSPLEDSEVMIEGVVVGDFQYDDEDGSRNLGGFFVQEETDDEDSDATTSEAIYVYHSDTDVGLGDTVRVTGTVDEYYGLTQLSSVSSVEIITDGDATSLSQVTPASISLASISTVTVNQDGDYQPDLEAYEGMLVTFPDTLTITEQYNLDRFNEIRLVNGERPDQFTQIQTPDANAYDAYMQVIGSNRIVFDDGQNSQNLAISLLDGFADYNEANAPRMGDQITGMTGVLDYQWAGNSSSGSTWRVRSHLDGSNSFTATAYGNSPNERPANGPDAIGGDIRLVSMNVLNFFKTLDASGVSTLAGHDPRGADDLSGTDYTDDANLEFDRQLTKLVNAIIEAQPDVLGLVEIENEFDAVNDGSTAIEILVNALNERAGTARYDYVYPGS